MSLPRDPNEPEFDALHDAPDAWRPVIQEIASHHAPGSSVTLPEDGSVLVGIADELVIKLYPPFMRGHFAFEKEALKHFAGKLSVATPKLVTSGDHSGWPYLVMTRLHGESLRLAWPRFEETDRVVLLRALGALVAEVHALPVQPLRSLAPRWSDFIATQRSACAERQRRTGLPAHLHAELEHFLDQRDSANSEVNQSEVVLTGEYTPMNLFVKDGQLAAMFDFGDGMIGPREYDWLGPMCFLAAGSRERQAAFIEGYSGESPRDWTALRRRLLRLLLLHRYSNLRGQLALQDWQSAPTLDALTELIWP
ncbi:MAG: aminoglycoside 3'-phosphotransferase/choline kinase family protein [Polyangiaceae bacterium]